MHAFLYPCFSRTQAASIPLWSGRPCKEEGVFGDERPSTVLETPKPDF